MTDTLNDVAWHDFLQENPTVLQCIDRYGFCDVQSSVLKHYREPRLMCKIDFLEQRPKILKRLRISVLAIVNKQYRLARTHPFIDIDTDWLQDKSIYKTFALPNYLHSLAATHITSESKALDAAYASGMLHELEQVQYLHLTVRGRSYSTNFAFALADSNGHRIEYPIAGVQLEVDGGYESHERLLLIEAKMGFADNMNLRQLLYPQLNYSALLRKPVVTYLMFYETGGLFHFLPFTYYNAIPEINYLGYRLFKLQQPILLDAQQLFNTPINPMLTGFGAPFPQADSMDTLLNLLLSMAAEVQYSKEELFADYALVPRQWDYYLNALIWLGLVFKCAEGYFSLTPRGHQMLELTEQERVFYIAQTAFSNDIFNAHLHAENPFINAKSRLNNGLSTDSTFQRRIQTVKAWRWYLFQVLRLNGRN